MEKEKKETRTQGLLEEVFNSVTHGIGIFFGIAMISVLTITAINNDRPALIVTGLVLYGAALVLLYLFSTLYHGLIFTKAKPIFKILDHSAIFLLIAGTYTPIAFQIGGGWGWSLFGIVTGCFILGTVLESVFGSKIKKISMILYVALGWMIVIAWNPMLDSVNYRFVFWLIAGGICYTGGIVFYALTEKRFFHVYWHLAVLAGSIFHFFGILFYIA